MVAFLMFVLLIARNCGELYSVVLPLLLLIPLPFGTDTNMVMRLQRVSSIGASSLLDSVGIRHVMSGNVLELADRSFFVAEACSGIGSVFLMLATAAVYVVWRRLRIVVAIPMLFSAVAWAVAGNTFRIFLVAVSHATGGPDLGQGMLHDLLGIVTYILSILLLFQTEQALLFVLDPIPETRANGQTEIKYGDSVSTSPVHYWNRRTSMESEFLNKRNLSRTLTGISVSPIVFFGSLIPVFVGFSIAAAWDFLPHAFNAANVSGKATDDSLTTKLASLPGDMFSQATMEPLLLDCRTQTRTSVKEIRFQGIHSRIWRLKITGTEIVAAVDGPFKTWHDPAQNYVSDGWKVLKRDFTRSPGIGNESSVVTQMELYLDTKDRALLLSGGFRQIGTPVSASASTTDEENSADAGDRFSGAGDRDVWQFRLFVQHQAELDTATQNFWTQTFLELFQDVIDRWRPRP